MTLYNCEVFDYDLEMEIQWVVLKLEIVNHRNSHGYANIGTFLPSILSFKEPSATIDIPVLSD